jgi:hypothetical protein
MKVIKSHYFVFSQCVDGERFAFAETIRESENILAFVARYNADYCMACSSRTEAEKIAIAWNESYKRNGTYPKWRIES